MGVYLFFHMSLKNFFKLLEGWRKKMAVHDIPFTEDLNIIKMLVDDPTIGEWNLQG